MNDQALFDEGLQPERTLLAWQRTCLAIAVGVVVAARLTLPTLGPLAIAFGLVGLMLITLAWLGVRRRYHRANLDLAGSDAQLTQDGVSVAAVGTGAALFAAAGMVFVLLSR